MNQLIDRCGLGMFTVWQSVTRDLYGTFCKVGEMGYKGIEYYGEPSVDLDLLRNALKDSGLQLTGWFTEWRFLQEDALPDTIKYLQMAGCPIAMIPGLGGKWNVGHRVEEECRDVWLRHIDKMNAINEMLKREGIRLGYHNHDHEFRLSYDGKCVFDMLFEGLSQDIIIELDTGNCIESGDDPLRVLGKYKERDMLLHLKPYSHAVGFETVLGAEGDANDWKEILNPENKKYLWLLIESENRSLPEIENAKLCLEGLKKYL